MIVGMEVEAEVLSGAMSIGFEWEGKALMTRHEEKIEIKAEITAAATATLAWAIKTTIEIEGEFEFKVDENIVAGLLVALGIVPISAMAITDARLNLLTFPQRWDGAQLSLRVLALPKGDPRQPLFAGAAAFAQSTLRLRARIIPSLDKMQTRPLRLRPSRPSPNRLRLSRRSSTSSRSPSTSTRRSSGIRIRPTRSSRIPHAQLSARLRLRRAEPQFVFTNNAYECALKDPSLTNRPPRPAPTDELSWGQAIAFAIRQPVLASALGLLFERDVALPEPDAFAAGGWLYVDLDDASDLAAEFGAQPQLLGLFAARIPPLSTPTAFVCGGLVPRDSGVTPALDEQFTEAESYDDGFAKIVHGSQPEHSGIVETEENATPAVKDIGIRLGWDDEQIAIWLNRQLDPAMLTPMGVAGYRVDVRNPGSLEWHSLTRAQGDVLLGDMNLGEFNDEFAVEAAPLQLAGKKTGDYWLPSYFTTWKGSSLVLRTETALRLAKREHVLAARPFSVPNASEIPDLRYGETYEFRVRLVDLSRGGPGVDAKRENPAPAPEATIRFRRFAPPKGVLLARHSRAASGSTAFALERPPAVARLSRCRFRRSSKCGGAPPRGPLKCWRRRARSRRAGSRRSPTRNHRGGPAAGNDGGPRRPERVFSALHDAPRFRRRRRRSYRPPDRQPGP